MPTSIPAPALDSLFVSESSSATEAGFGWNLSQDKDPPSSSPFPLRTDHADRSGAIRNWIAIVEDNVADVELIRFALRGSGVDLHLRVFADGDEAFRFLDEVERGAAECPVLFVLDLNLPKRSGRHVLARIRKSPACKDATVVVLSSSAAEQDKREAAQLGANRYITKPIDLDEYLEIGDALKAMLPRVDGTQ
jgi:two-component system, chemotaxis family, response regulator Rcp1